MIVVILDDGSIGFIILVLETGIRVVAIIGGCIVGMDIKLLL
jgi:hypothetical protein